MLKFSRSLHVVCHKTAQKSVARFMRRFATADSQHALRHNIQQLLVPTATDSVCRFFPQVVFQEKKLNPSESHVPALNLDGNWHTDSGLQVEVSGHTVYWRSLARGQSTISLPPSTGGVFRNTVKTSLRRVVSTV